MKVGDPLGPLASALRRVRPLLLVALLGGAGVAAAMGAWAVSVGLVLSAVVCVGLLFRSVDKRFQSQTSKADIETGTFIVMATVGILPTLVVGIICLAVTHKYWWLGFPAGWFLGSAFCFVGLYGAIVVGVRRSRLAS
jgi:hypothetical protein